MAETNSDPHPDAPKEPDEQLLDELAAAEVDRLTASESAHQPDAPTEDETEAPTEPQPQSDAPTEDETEASSEPGNSPSPRPTAALEVEVSEPGQPAPASNTGQTINVEVEVVEPDESDTKDATAPAPEQKDNAEPLESDPAEPATVADDADVAPEPTQAPQASPPPDATEPDTPTEPVAGDVLDSHDEPDHDLPAAAEIGQRPPQLGPRQEEPNLAEELLDQRMAAEGAMERSEASAAGEAPPETPEAEANGPAEESATDTRAPASPDDQASDDAVREAAAAIADLQATTAAVTQPATKVRPDYEWDESQAELPPDQVHSLLDDNEPDDEAENEPVEGWPVSVQIIMAILLLVTAGMLATWLFFSS